MATPTGPLAVLGATGYTGRLVVEQARILGLPLRLVGRRREALEALAAPGDEIRVADARAEGELIEAFDGAFAVASCAGPFLEVGPRPVAAAVAAGVHWLDTTGEQAFARLVYEGFGDSAEERGVVLLTAFGFDYVPGDLAARLAAAELAEPLDELVVAYSVSGFASSAGTRRTVGRILKQPLAAWVDGRPVETRFGATTRRFAFPFGERDAVEWGGTEPLTVPRHTRVGTVRSYVRAPRAAGRLARLGRLAAPLVRLSARGRGGPSEERRAGTRFAVVAEASGPAGRRRATLVGSDPYGFTARAIARGAEALARGEARGLGALAPAEAFYARDLVERLAPYCRLESVEEF